jgi:hypothetical protein
MFDPRLLLVAAAAITARTAAAAPHDTKPAARVVTVVARDYAFDAPDTITAGRTEVRLVNRGREAHHAYLVRLDKGKSLDALLAALRAGGPMPSWTHDVGGPNSPVPGGTSVAVVDLTPGSYAVLCVIPAADGMPHIMKGMGHAFTVVAGAPAPKTTLAAKVGAPDITVDLADYAFTLSRPLTRGHHVLRVRNTAAQSHEMFVARLMPGKTAQDAMAWLESQKGPPPMVPLGGTVGLAHGVSNDIALDLTPGEYALFCFIPDAKDGKPHVAHGMVKPFTVR